MEAHGPQLQRPEEGEVNRSYQSATSLRREGAFQEPEHTGYMSDDSGARALTRGASRKLNKTLRQLNPFKVPARLSDVCWMSCCHRLAMHVYLIRQHIPTFADVVVDCNSNARLQQKVGGLIQRSLLLRRCVCAHCSGVILP